MNFGKKPMVIRQFIVGPIYFLVYVVSFTPVKFAVKCVKKELNYRKLRRSTP